MPENRTFLAKACFLALTLLAPGLVLGNSDRHKLGDLQQEPPPKKSRKKPAPPADPTPEDRKQMLKAQNPPTSKPSAQDAKVQSIGRLEGKMNRSLAEKDWQNAFGAAKKILAIDPSHANARKQKTAIEGQLFEHAVRRGEAKEKAGNLQSAVDAYKTALSYRADPQVQNKISDLQLKLAYGNKKRSEELYLRALKISQTGQRGEALRLCNQALKIDPNNLQARRMQERLRRRN